MDEITRKEIDDIHLHNKETNCDLDYLKKKEAIKSALVLITLIITFIGSAIAFALSTTADITGVKKDTAFIQKNVDVLNGKFDNIDRKLDIIIKRTNE